MGGGGGTFIPSTSEAIQRKIEEARENARKGFNSSINEYLQGLLAGLNERDADQTRERLKDITDKLSDVGEVDQLLFGGSVAKHTYVDGLSDVDALVVLDRSDVASTPPRTLLGEFSKVLRDRLRGNDVKSIEKGTMAVTVTYSDGTEIQLLPALRTGSKVLISDSGGKNWKETKPRAFQRTLTTANDRLNGCLVPAIKLAKSVVASLPRQKQVSGYHMESLAVDAVKGYQGEKTPRALLGHILEQASKRVLRPIRDVTGQSRSVDAELGPANSAQRRNVSMALASTHRRLQAATSITQWQAMFED